MSGYAIITGNSEHLTDGMLLAVLDDEAEGADAERAHLSSCRECGNRYALLITASNLLASTLPPVAKVIMPMPVPRPKRWWVGYPAAAAASVLIVASAAAATPPVREWIVRQFSHPETPAPAAPAPVTPPPAVAGKGMIASFAATDTQLVIRIDRRQSTGDVELVASTSDRISAQVLAGAAAEELIVLPGQLRIANTAGSIAGYRIAIPAFVKSVQLIVDDGKPIIVRAPARVPLR